jgi:hypothetical protein
MAARRHSGITALDQFAACHGLITSTPAWRKSARLRVAKAPPRARQIAAICASNPSIGRPSPSRWLTTRAYCPAAAHPVRAQPGISLTCPPDNQCVISRNRVTRALNSTTAQPRATARPRAQLTAPHAHITLTCPNEERRGDILREERLPQTAPATHETRPTGPGLTCEFAGGRCWVRTNVGLADGFTDGPPSPHSKPLTCRFTAKTRSHDDGVPSRFRASRLRIRSGSDPNPRVGR